MHKTLQVVYEAALCLLLLRAKNVKGADHMIAKTEELGYAVSTQAKVALVRLKTMQRNADQGC